jgi:glycyl-tRNA synthetase alpha subunit
MNTKIQRLAIKLFKLNDFQKTLVAAKNQQKKEDKKYYNDIFSEKELELANKHFLEMSELQAQINILKEEKRVFKKLKKALNDKERSLNVQAKENTIISTHFTNKTRELGHAVVKITEEMTGLRHDAQVIEKNLIQYKKENA